MTDATPSGADGPIRISPPPPDGILTISGGVGGITVQLEELDLGAGKLDGLADRLAGIEGELLTTWQELGRYQYQPRGTGTAALAAVGEARNAVQGVRAELQRISGQVRNCRREYDMAESFARIQWMLGLSSPEAEFQKHVDFWRTGFLNGEATASLLGNAVTALPLLKPLVGGTFPAMRSGPVTARQEESVAIELDASPAGLLERVRLIEERGAGCIEVIEVENQGAKAYLVVVPGTQVNGSDNGTNPFDLGGIADGLGNNSAEVNGAVLQALRETGAEPGAQVVAVGYSQGGIHAMNLAADERFRKEYDMAYVLTAGSPISRITPPADVSSLHLEHRTDWVPGSDGSPNPDTRNQVTVGIQNDLYVRGGEDTGLGPGHRLSGYEDAARLVGASDDPSLVHSTAVLSGVLGAGGTATATRYSLSRAKAPSTALAPPDARARERHLGGR